MRLGILGGTFNPIHYGHLRPAEEIRERLVLDKVLFIPSARPPHKGSVLVKPEHRLRMVEIAIKGNPHFEVSSVELERKEKSYTVKTLEELLEEYGKEMDFFFILGIDSFLELPTWMEPERLFTLTNFVITSRPPLEFYALKESPYLKDISKSPLREIDEGKILSHSIKLGTGKRVYMERVSMLEISSTEIRRYINVRKSIKYLLPEEVELYIIAENLYK
ncbi:MAG: nicotinate-nucleotide adenylyltransferase [Nitrospirota bacterium]